MRKNLTKRKCFSYKFRKMCIRQVPLLLIIANKENDLYLSFTQTGEENNTLMSRVYTLDVKTEKVNKITEIPYTSQYPQAVYDKKHKTVYYTAKDESGSADQVYAKDMKTGQSKKISKDFYAINYLFPFDEKLFIGGVLKTSEDIVVSPFLYDIKKRQISNLSWNNDLHLQSIAFDPVQKDFIMSGYSASDQWKRIQNQDKEEYKPGINYVYTMKEGEHKLLYQEAGLEVYDVAITQGHAYICDEKSRLSRIEKGKKTEDILREYFTPYTIIYYPKMNVIFIMYLDIPSLNMTAKLKRT